VKNLDKEELAQWMEARGIGQALRGWASNKLLGRRNYDVLEDLATKGEATLKIIHLPSGLLKIESAKTFETEATNLEAENKELKKTVKTQEKEIMRLREEKEITRLKAKKETKAAKKKPKAVTNIPPVEWPLEDS